MSLQADPSDVVVDASALVKLMADEEWAPELRKWVVEMHARGARFHAPHLIRYEVGHFLATRTRDTAPVRVRRLAMALAGVLFSDGESEPFAPPLTYYDASYVALAKAIRAPLVSYDEKQRRTAAAVGISLLAPGRDRASA